MIRRPPRSTRTDTLFPYTTLFRSQEVAAGGIVPVVAVEKSNPTFRLRQGVGLAGSLVERQGGGGHVGVVVEGCRMLQPAVPPGMVEAAVALHLAAHEGEGLLGRSQPSRPIERERRLRKGGRSEEPRVGKEGDSTGRTRWSPY